MARVAINGLGRIGRAALKIIMDTPELELVAVNDLTPPDNLAYLLRYDSVYGRYEREISCTEDSLVVDGRAIKVFNSKDPAALPWRDLNIDLVFECTGKFTSKDGFSKHVQAGAKNVILSAPSKGEDVPTIIYGVNEVPAGTTMVSCASCTTNSIAPVIEIIGRRVGIRKAIMTTLHAYTASQSLVDGPNKKFRRGRAAAVNFVPAETGAAKATTRALPQYKGKFDGTAVRAPVPVGSVSDVTIVTARPTSVEEINTAFREEAGDKRYSKVLSFSDEQIVSSDIIMDSHASILDSTMTRVVDGDLVKVMTWYDNEWGYSSQMVRTAVQMVRQPEKAGVGS
jgi:glyceraldehyde 3-phosphate dehydrogenase